MRAGAVLLLVLVLGGCSSPAPAPGPEALRPANDGREAFAPPEAELPTTLPPGSVAVEVLSWGTRDEDDEVGDTLAALARRVDGPMAEVAERLRAQGLRLVRLDARDVGAFFEISPPLGAVRRRIIQPGGRFEDVVDGATLEEARTVGTALGARDVGPGSARLALRVWSSVGEDGALDVRADLVGVIASASRPGRTEALLGDRQRVLRGRLVDGLASHLVLRPDEAWAIVAASPDAEWTPINASDEPPAPASTPFDPALEARAPTPVGPDVTPLRTSGEALFTRAQQPLSLGDEPARLVILLVARAPERFSLFAE